MNFIPVCIAFAWGIGYLTGCFTTRKEYKKDIEDLRNQRMKSEEQLRREVSRKVTGEFYARLAKVGITLERASMLVEKNCLHCVEKDKCAIHDNFNIDFCSDWREKK